MISVHNGDALEVLRKLPDGSVHSIVTDPPYLLGFMNKSWDKGTISYSVELWSEVLRIAKPGAHLLAFGGTRTYHRMACAIEDAWWEIRDSLHWLYGQGFPKSHNLDGEHAGVGTALKPSHEPIVLARKPLEGTVAENVLKHGVGGIHVDACRVGSHGGGTHCTNRDEFGKCLGHAGEWRTTHASESDGSLGRWPPNVLLSGDAIEELDQQSGASVSRIGKPRGSKEPGEGWGMTKTGAEYEDSGGASRFFPCFRYVPKASRSERGEFNDHTTVKPIELMRWLVRLVTPPNGTVLDPFAGSGTTAVACIAEGNFDFIGIEQDGGYCDIAIKRAKRESPLFWNAPAKAQGSAKV